MSNTAMKVLRIDSTTAFFILFLGLLGPFGCTRKSAEPDLPVERPVFATAGTPFAESISRLEISARPPGISAWNARLEKDATGRWHLVARTDRAGDTSDLADQKLVRHFLEVVGSFATEAPAGTGNDAGFGLNPYRMEIRASDLGSTKILRLGDPVGLTGIYFRVGEASKKTWIGRGALIAFLPTLETPDAFLDKLPYSVSLDEIRGVRLEKLREPDRGVWNFSRNGDRWFVGKLPLSAEKAGLLERIVRQRVVRVLPLSNRPDFRHPDWKITVRTAGGEETLAVTFVLNDIFAANPARSDRGLELYPEFAGALRAFTQARFTSRKSETK
jgi:hypothetical protein